jgi:phenylpyruvate tautomerase PptA (4-oxalocrotonate tautomerase family)
VEKILQMPYLQLDTPFSYSAEAKQRLAKRLGEIYSEKMNSNINRLTVAMRELGEGCVWRCGEGDPRPAALLMCDIRRGRPAQQRAELARMLIDVEGRLEEGREPVGTPEAAYGNRAPQCR